MENMTNAELIKELKLANETIEILHQLIKNKDNKLKQAKECNDGLFNWGRKVLEVING
jgi:hypothetical protein